MAVQNSSTLVAAYYHTHWDREWYLPFRAYQVRLAEVVDEILERLETNVLPCFMLDGQTVVLDDYLELRPENRQRLRNLIESGRLSIGPWLVMPDEFLVSGESLIRNLALGIRESQAWGCFRFTGYLPDTFGHSADIPTLLRQVGIDSAVIWRGVNPRKSLFQWRNQAGYYVHTLHLTDGYFQMMLHDWTATADQQQTALASLAQKLQTPNLTNLPILLPIGGDHLAPVTQLGHRQLLNQYPQLLETTPERYFQDLMERDQLPSNGKLETVEGELTDNSDSFLLPGVYSARMYLKQANRQLEHRLIHQVEPLLAILQSLSLTEAGKYPVHELALAWKTLIFNHPHDSICGCSVDAVHRENEVRFDQVSQLTEAISDRAWAVMSQHLAGPEEWLILNTGATPYTGVVPAFEDYTEPMAQNGQSSHLYQIESKQVCLQDEYRHNSHRIPLSHLTTNRTKGWIWVEAVPALGYQIVPKQEASAKQNYAPVKVAQHLLENSRLTIQIQADGTLQITDQQTHKTYSGLLQFQAMADQGDSYNSAPVPDSAPHAVRFIGSQVVLNGPLVGSVRVTHEIPSLDLTLQTEIRLFAESERVEFTTEFTSHKPNYKLQVGFLTDQPVSTVTAESHLSVVKRCYDPDFRLIDHMPAQKMKELKPNTGPIQRFFSANGQSWITEGLAEYEVDGPTVWITLLRAFSHLSKADTGVRGAQAGPPFETPEGQCQGRSFTCRYAWLPEPASPQHLYEQAGQFYGNVSAQSGKKSTEQCLLSLENKPQRAYESTYALLAETLSEVVVSACYWKPGKGLFVRLLNPHEKTVTVPLSPGFSVVRTHEVNFLEEPVQALGQETLHIKPHDVKTVWLEV